MTAPLLRASILPEAELPEADGLIAEGARLAGSVGVGDCPFLSEHGVPSEIAYKERRMAAGAIMFHALVGLTTPGGITEHGLKLVDERGALGAWSDACQSVLDRLNKGS